MISASRTRESEQPIQRIYPDRSVTVSRYITAHRGAAHYRWGGIRVEKKLTWGRCGGKEAEKGWAFVPTSFASTHFSYLLSMSARADMQLGPGLIGSEVMVVVQM